MNINEYKCCKSTIILTCSTSLRNVFSKILIVINNYFKFLVSHPPCSLSTLVILSPTLLLVLSSTLHGLYPTMSPLSMSCLPPPGPVSMPSFPLCLISNCPCSHNHPPCFLPMPYLVSHLAYPTVTPSPPPCPIVYAPYFPLGLLSTQQSPAVVFNAECDHLTCL